jgi:hypothetical protein
MRANICEERYEMNESVVLYGIRHVNLICDSKKDYSFCLMVEASDHGYVLHTRRMHVTRYRIRYDMM